MLKSEEKLSGLEIGTLFKQKKYLLKNMISHQTRTFLHAIVGCANALKKVPEEISDVEAKLDCLTVSVLEKTINDIAANVKESSATFENKVTGLYELVGEKKFAYYLQTARKKFPQESIDPDPVIKACLKNLLVDVSLLKTVWQELGEIALSMQNMKKEELLAKIIKIANSAAKHLAGMQVRIEKLNEVIIGCTASQKLSVSLVEEVDGELSRRELLRILIVDDNFLNQKILANVFKNTQSFLEVANNGEEAVQKFLESKFDIIFMDINMPVMDGLEAARKIRQLEQEKNYPETPIIALTADEPSAKNKYDTLRSGMNGFHSKPFTAVEILGLIRRHVLLEGANASSDNNKENVSSSQSTTLSFSY